MMLSETLNTSSEVCLESPLVPSQTTTTTVAPDFAAEPLQALKKKRPLLYADAVSSFHQSPPPSQGTTRQFLRMPCKARGMSTKHNSDTAFLDIPVDAPHGFLLSCSHPECTESGRRFRYCTICANPVAKRNFPKRHGHGLIKSTKDLKAVDYMRGFMDSTSSTEDASCSPCGEAPTVLFAVNALPGASAPSFEKPRHRRVVSYETVLHAAAKSAALRQQEQATLSAAAAPAVKSFLDLSAHEQQWLQLLHERPRHENAVLSSWMDKIIQVSEAYRSSATLTTSAQIVSGGSSPTSDKQHRCQEPSQQESDPTPLVVAPPHNFPEPMQMVVPEQIPIVAPPGNLFGGQLTFAPTSNEPPADLGNAALFGGQLTLAPTSNEPPVDLGNAALFGGQLTFAPTSNEPPADLGNAAMQQLLQDEATAIDGETSAFAAVLDTIDMPPIFE
jgi:hypothetical protein